MSDTNRAVQPHKMVRGLKCRIKEAEELYYLCSYCTADLHLCFRICKKQASHDAAQLYK